MSSDTGVSFTMSSKQPCFKCVRPVVEDFARGLDLGEKVVFFLTLVLDELITNIQSYGYLDLHEHFIHVDMSMCAETHVLTIQICDDAREFNILEAPDPELETPLENRIKPIGGMGIHLVKKKMDEISYSRVNGHNVLVLKKKIDAEQFAKCKACGAK